jgi:hypothetical protein
MKKNLLALSILFCLSLFIYGQDYEDSGSEDAAASRSINFPSWMTGEGAALSTGRRESRSRFELGLLDLTFSGVLDGVDLFGGFSFDPAKIKALNVDLDILTSPLYVRIPVREVFVLDVFIRADVDVRLNLSEDTINALKDIESLVKADTGNPADYITELEKVGGIKGGMSAGASAFTELGMGISKTLLGDRLWLRAAPSLYFTLLYMKHSSVTMQGYNESKKFGLQAIGSMDLYSAWDLKNGAVNPFASAGLDITLEGCYALWPVLDLGLSVSHIPIIPSTLTHRMTVDVEGLTMFFDTSNPVKSALEFHVPDLDGMIEPDDSDNKTVMRPVRFDFYGLVKPFKSPVLIVQPNIGATVNSAFSDTAFFNWGLTLRYHAPRIFSAFIGSGLTEGVWAQRAGIALDFRVFEFGLSAALAGATFAESWSANGLIAGVGFKFGF